MNINNTQGSPEGVYTPEPRVYELGYLIMPTVDEGNLSDERDALVALITKFKGIVISEEVPQLVDLAYDMTKMIDNKKHTYSQAYFGWIKFDVTPDVVEALTDESELGGNIIRSIMVKTVRDNTLVSEQPFKLARVNRSDEEGEDEDFGGAELADEPETEETAKPAASTEGEVPPAASISDDLSKIEGVGPVIAELLNKKGIHTYGDLSASKVGDVRDWLEAAGLTGHEPKTWSKQATLAKHAKWDELKTLQDLLQGGKEE
ncbi:MAG: putative flap endonuclease-1-like 5' DNA nuclease [Candidatus Paceibacteria bacterium]|jgi:predicted flap endonuclease-1-like 5' DNA nuclease